MLPYKSPGVYVKEEPSAVQPIAGVGTSTAGFIGVVPNEITVPKSNPDYNPNLEEGETIEVAPTVEHLLGQKLVSNTLTLEAGTKLNEVQVKRITSEASTNKISLLLNKKEEELKAKDILLKTVTCKVNDTDTELEEGIQLTKPQADAINADDRITEVKFKRQIKASDVSKDNVLADPYEIQLDDLGDGNIIKTATLAQEIADLLDPQKVRAENSVAVKPTFTLPDDPGQVKLCTNFGQFKKYFGDFSDTTTTNQNRLAHAVYGFFQNGGTRCYVARVEENEAYVTNLKKVLEEKFEAIDEIAIVAAPGLTGDEKNGPVLRDAIITHCKATEDRFAIFDSPETVESGGKLDLTLLGPPNEKKFLPDNSDYAAFYFPWIKVFDPVKKTTEPTSDGQIAVPPSGHMAGIYARVDASRGVHKAPANEVVLGALGLQYQLSRNQQNGLNPHGVNCIRDLNGNIRVWGARTIGGDKNGEWRYIPVRRLFLFLRESIDEGLQWTVFEPNEPALWAKITRNVTAFLMNVWRSGALFGATPEQAFYVKCDAETNPPEVRDLGQVVTEIGVAVVKPAEFVIFKISQWAGPSGG